MFHACRYLLALSLVCSVRFAAHAQTALRIEAGDSVKVKLAVEIRAPIDGSSQSVVFDITGPVKGPNGSDLTLNDAHLVALAQGSQTDGRVLLRLKQLKVRSASNQLADYEVDGWIVGADGLRGLPGTNSEPRKFHYPEFETGEPNDHLESERSPVVEAASGTAATAVFARPLALGAQ